MLKKARSFRDKLRKGPFGSKTAGTSSNFGSTLARTLSISGRDDKKRAVRDPAPAQDKNSPTTAERPTTLAEEKSQLLSEPPNPNVEKVKNEQRKVQQAIKYINFAIERNNMVLLPGSATVALEMTFELITLITGLLSSEEPRADLNYRLSCTYNCLAELIDWADQVMLMDMKSQLDVANAKRVINAIESSVNDLTEFACDIAKHLKVQTTPTLSMMTLPSKARQKRAANSEERVKRNSMPEVPLTPREKTILRETSLGAFDNPLVADKGDASTPSSPTEPIKFVDEESPPPKPYLPPDFNLLRTLSNSSSIESPPELPSKNRPALTRSQAIGSSSTDSLDASFSSKPSSDGTYTSRPRSALIADHLTRIDNYDGVRSPGLMFVRTDRSAHSSGQLFSSHDSIDGPVGKRSSVISTSSLSSAGHSSYSKPSLSGISERGPNPNAPLAHHEDLSPIQPITAQHNSGIKLDDLSSRIEQLAIGLVSRPDGLGLEGQPRTTFPEQRRPRAQLDSDYDNVSNESADSPCTPPGGSSAMISSDLWVQRSNRNVINRSCDMLTSVSQWQQQQMSGHTQWTVTNKGYEQQTQSITLRTTTESRSMSSSHQRVTSGTPFEPPPLPPKRKHVESYMHVFGTEMELSEYHPVESSNSKQFYLHMQEQYQLELFHSQATVVNNGAYMCPPHALEMEKQMLMQADFMEGHVAGGPALQGQVEEGRVSPVPAVDEGVEDPVVEDEVEGDFSELNPLDMVDIRDMLVRDNTDTNSTSSDSAVGSLSTISSGSKNSSSLASKRSSKILSGLKGGSVDALVVYATHVGKHDLYQVGSFLSLSQADIDTDFMYQEAFLTTYRTFISPDDLIDKLLYRYNKFAHVKDVTKKRLSRNAFSLLVRVVDELTCSEMKNSVSLRLLQLVTSLVREGELTLAKIMRRKVLEKCDPNLRPVEDIQILASGLKSPNSRAMSLLDFKSQELAEQLTLLENDFYQRLELPELLIWSKEQNEEKCPNLVEFTEHFNKMSYWCRSAILKPDDPAVREKYFCKFVHILKHLRKHNNFNSLLALLSALDSAPVSRLDWPKQERDIIQDFSSLIDCTSSFKSYRMALAEAQPPCIPYIGLILNDMTIIRVGNKPSLIDGGINFQMRWQLFNVLECLRRFRKPAYTFKKDQRILQCLDNFSDYNSNDDEMWERSKEIKPTNMK